MPNEDHAMRFPDEVHRYFPEWADRPASADALFESDHNSYLAGGYSEEFGYRVWPDRPPVFPLLHDDPESARQWCFQIGCLHPGYPECPRPADRIEHAGVAAGALDGRVGMASRSSAGNSRAGHTHVLRVNRSGAERGALRWPVATMLWTRLRARSRIRDRGI